MAHLRDNTLTLDKGERLVFPVSRDHPVAACQQLREIRSFEDLKEFVVAKEWQTAYPTRRPGDPSPPDPTFSGGMLSPQSIVEAAKLLGQIVRIQLAGDLVIPAGSTLVMQNPFNEITAGKITVAGRLEAHGDLAITCNEITGL